MSYAGEPKAPKPDPSTAPQEPTGPVAADSLAAESTNAGGAFSENENIALLSVKGGQSTLANTDTSGATVLPAAVDGTSREKTEVKGLGSDERGVSGVKYPDADVPEYTGTHSQEGYVGGSTAAAAAAEKKTVTESYSGASGDSFADGAAPTTTTSASEPSADTIKSSSGSSAGPAPGTGATAVGASGDVDSAGTAPSYVAAVTGSLRTEGELNPKGENLVEGGIPETKTFTGNVGGDKDPGRLALQDFEKSNAEVSGVGNDGKEGDTSNPFGVLSSERA